jgi:hypothetical protein
MSEVPLYQSWQVGDGMGLAKRRTSLINENVQACGTDP